MKGSKSASTGTKPVQKWSARELQAYLLPAVTQASRSELREFMLVLNRLEKALEKERSDRQGELDGFRVTGDADSQVLGVLGEVFSRPLRQALVAVNDRVFVVKHAKKVVEKRLAQE